MSSTPKPLVAFFGATGGCTLQALTLALKAGNECTALARTPSKLTDLLIKKDVPRATIDSNLHITQGDVRDVPTVKASLTVNGHPAEIILSGIGATSLSELSSSSLDLCKTAVSNILAALTELKAEGKSNKPLLVALGSTGMTEGNTPSDLPFLMKPMYKFMLANPHRDKKQMETAIYEHIALPENEHVIRGFVLPRPSFLTNGAARGGSKVRVGFEDKPAVGYTISRDDVGLWLFENLIDGKETEKFVGHLPTITY